MIMSVGHDIAQLPHFFAFTRVDEPGKLIFFKAILYYWCKCSISTYWNGKLDVFFSKKKNNVTIQQQYICKFSTSNFKCHSCTFNRTCALIESSICKLWKQNPFFLSYIVYAHVFWHVREVSVVFMSVNSWHMLHIVPRFYENKRSSPSSLNAKHSKCLSGANMLQRKKKWINKK